MAGKDDNTALSYAFPARPDASRPSTREQRRRIWLSPLVALLVISALVAGLMAIAWLAFVLLS